MAEETERPRSGLLRDIIISGVVGAGVIGLIVTVAGPFIVDWIRAGVEEQGLDGFWLPIGRVVVTIALALALVALVVFAAVSVVSRRWRERIWSRPVGWLGGVRLTTQAGRDRARKEAEKRGFALSTEQLKPAYETANARAIALTNDLAKANFVVMEKDKELQALREEVAKHEEAENKRQSREILDTVIRTPPGPPLPRPRWVAAPDNGDDLDTYVIQNMVPRSVAREVRVEADEDMDIIDAGHWADLSTDGPDGGVGVFKAVVNERGRMNYVSVAISWYDERGERDWLRKDIYPRPLPDSKRLDDTPF